MKHKGFTLIELLAVIIILGILMLIAIPSVTSYLDRSRKESYISTLNGLVKGASTLVNSGEIDVSDSDTTYYIPCSCIELENGDVAVSPYGQFDPAYILATLEEDGSYNYYFKGRDSSGFGMNVITSSKELKPELMQKEISKIETREGVGNRKLVTVFNDDCKTIKETKNASSRTYDGEGAQFISGFSFNRIVKTLVNGSYSSNYDYLRNIKYFKMSNSSPSEENMTSEHIVSSANSKEPIYVWQDGEILYVYVF